MEILQITIHAHDDKRNELLRTCRLIADRTRSEIACKSSRVSQDYDNRDIIALEQQWERWASLTDYFKSEHFSALLGAMKWLGRTYKIRINGGRREEGEDAVERAREVISNSQ
ncbi:MAG: hypothetical protein GY866_41580 [Proteobacteria bacterium]|nr:hypothetical protein [Pseudomonadota bacterium]